MSKNVRISLYIVLTVVLWFTSKIFVAEEVNNNKVAKTLSSVVISETVSSFVSPQIKLNTYASTEKRVEVKAKTSGEVVSTGVLQGDWVEKDDILCSLGVVELNRTEVKAPFRGYVESIVKPGNFIQRGQICATIIELDPITFISEVPEKRIKDVNENQTVSIQLATGEIINTKLSFVSKSASPATRTFRVEAVLENGSGLVRDGITGTMIINTNKVLAHKINPSNLLLADNGELGIRTVNIDNVVEFHVINIIQDTEDGLWVTGLPEVSNVIVMGQGFVEEGQTVSVSNLAKL